jgi:hypothetical protein
MTQYPTYIGHDFGFAYPPTVDDHDHLYASELERYEVEVGGSWWTAGCEVDDRCIVCGKHMPDEPDGVVLSCAWEEPPAELDE